MKKPNLQTVPTGNNTKPLDKIKGRKVRKSESEKAIKRSFSILPEHNAYIEKFALEEGQKRGKSMTASEALRLIINKAQGKS